jgi:hypothetical protein
MSFDLTLYRPKESPPLTAEEIRAAFAEFPELVKFSDDIEEWDYQDPATGDYTQFEVVDDGDDSEDNLEDEPFESIGPIISFHTGWVSSEANVQKTMATVVAIVNRLDLKVWDGQSEVQTPEQPTPDDLIQSWNEGSSVVAKSWEGGSGIEARTESKGQEIPINAVTFCGAIGFVCAGVGILQEIPQILDYARMPTAAIEHGHQPIMFYSMAAITCLFLLVLAVISHRLMRQSTESVPTFSLLLILEMAYILMSSGLLRPRSATPFYIGVNSGASNVGFLPQVFTGFPIWSLILLNAGRLRRKRLDQGR